MQGAEQFAVNKVAGPHADVAVQFMEDTNDCTISWTDPFGLSRTALNSSANWETFDTVWLTNASQWYFDVSVPVAAGRFYRSWQTNTLNPPSVLDLHMATALTLTGTSGSSLRLDYINQFGPIDASVTLDTITLTSSPQLYFDTSVTGQPQRLYRVVPVP